MERELRRPSSRVPRIHRIISLRFSPVVKVRMEQRSVYTGLPCFPHLLLLEELISLPEEWNQGVGANANGNTTFGLFAAENGATIDLSEDGLSMGIFEQAVSNIAYLRAQTGGGMSRLNFAADSLSSMETNMRAAIGRIEDVDIAEESANLAKFSILTQASAAMVAQANTTNDVALMLLR